MDSEENGAGCEDSIASGEHIDSSGKCIQVLKREFSQPKTGLVCQRVQVAGLKEDAAMSDDLHSAPVIRNIAVATDFCPWSERALQHALVLARHFGAVLHILHVVRRTEFSFVPDLMVRLDELAERDFDDLIGRLNAAHSLVNIEHRCWNIDGDISGVFEDFVRDHRIDLMILGTRGRTGISKFLLGSIAQEIFHFVSCPVLTLGPWSRGATRQLQLNKVLFATDLSPESAAVIPYVLMPATTWRAEIDLLHICSSANSQCQNRMEDLRRGMEVRASGEAPLVVRHHVLPGPPSPAVLNFAMQEKADLIVLGLDHHRSLYGGPSVSHAYEIVRQARCPVLSVSSASLIVGQKQEQLVMAQQETPTPELP
ncbi:MAG: universal stress protein [Terracidiphilus sp.]